MTYLPRVAYVGCRADFVARNARCETDTEGAHARVRDSALKFKQARAHETDEIEAVHGNSTESPRDRDAYKGLERSTVSVA